MLKISRNSIGTFIILKRLFYFLITLIFFSCENSHNKKISSSVDLPKNSIVKYAKGFDIQKFTDHKKLIIRNLSSEENHLTEYILTSKSKNEDVDFKTTIQLPISKIVVSSTTHIPMLELLGVENTLVGFQGTDYISSKKTRKRIDQGFVKELGSESSMNTEVLFNLDPDLMIGFSMNKTNKTYNFIENNGIPVLINGDWLEETPLGRAEWIKFFGVLFDKEKKADSIFKRIESNYYLAKNIAKKNRRSPTVLSGSIMQNNIWSLPAGESFVAKFLEDANTNYLWKETKGKGSLQLSFESVFEKAQDADFWLAPGYFSSKNELLDSNIYYEKFSAFKKNKIYTISSRKGETGGIIYYELALTRPDLVLKDIIKITQPDVLPDYELQFFDLMK